MFFIQNLIKLGCLKDFCFYDLSSLSFIGIEFKYCK